MKINVTFILILLNNIYCQNSENNLNTSNNLNTNTYCNKNIKFCLSCKADKCLLCDFNKQYYLNSNKDSCVKCEEAKTNCLFTLDCGTCQICQSGYSLCSGNCVKNKDNCLEGDFCNTRNCSICTQNYFLNEGSCTRVATIIPNCKTYENANLCRICEDGYNISTNKQKCNGISSISITNTNISTTISNNCFVNLGNKFSCSSCKYRNNSIFYKFDILNPLKILEEKIINFTNSNILATIKGYNSLNSLKGLIDKNKVCIQRTITNCIEINNTTNYTCLKCIPNYYLLNGVCTLYSENTENGISGCQEYELSGNDLTCRLCESNYNKINSQTCQKLRSIDGCLAYNFDRSSCVNCNNVKGYKILNNSCTRINNYSIIENCINYYESGTNEGKCQNCINGYNNVNFTTCNLIETKNNNQNNDQGDIIINSIKQCYPTITDCVYYNKYSGKCLACRNNKIPSLDGNCNLNAWSTQFCDIFYRSNCRSCARDKFFIESTKICEERTINNSKNLCKHNYPTLLRGFRVNGDGTNTSSNAPTFAFYNCQECVNTSFVIDSNNWKNCIPRLKPNSDDPYKDSVCNGSQIRVRHNNSSNKILTCRSISGIIGNLYKNDINCYTYKSSLDNFTDFKTENTLCAICKSGFSIQNKRCTVIENCITDSSKFGGCSRCSNENLIIDITGDICVTKINNCEIIVGQYCIKCQNNYYGILNQTISSTVDRTGQLAYLGFEGEPLKINLRDNNQVKISKYRWFFYTQNNKIKFTSCSNNNNLFAIDNSLSNASNANSLNTEDLNRIFAINPSTTYAALCRKGNYIKHFNNYYKCSPIEFEGNTTISNLIYNNFLNNVISKDCGTNNNLILRNGIGPFCTVKADADNDNTDPIQLNENFIANCKLHYFIISIGSRFLITKNIYCMFCGGNRYVNKLGNSCDNYTNATTDIVVYCLNFTDGVCTSCPNGMTIINNACVNSTQILWTGGKTITNFKSENNCGLISWNQNLEGNRTAFNLLGNNDTFIAKCETCMSNDYIMNYENSTCIRKNRYNFSDCLSTGIGIGCVNCLNGKISFAATVVHEFCINTPPNGEFKENSKDNCLIYELNSQQNYQCYECQIGFMKNNGVCNRGVSYCRSHISTSNCRSCQNGYYLNSQRNQCIKGNIKYCGGYVSENICIWCENNYTLYGDSNEVICIDARPIHNIISNCDQVRSLYRSRNLYCYCNGGTIPLTNTPYTQQIRLGSYIENCITYNTSDISICTQCKSDLLQNGSYRNNLYILESNSCVSRTPINNCHVYINNSNRCLTCNKGYYFNSNRECQINPISNNCRYILFNKNCLLCKLNYYLNTNNECILVSSNKIIENCYRYNKNQDCEVCIRGYMYNSENNSCVALSTKNFLDNNNNCKFDLVNGYPNNLCQCNNVDYYFNSESKMCMQINNCLKINNGLCTQCSTKMFYNEENSTCISVTNIIENCDLYSNKDNCIKCNTGFGLKNNICERINKSDIIENCSNYSPNTKCLMCKPGNYISNGSCLSLSNNRIFLSSISNKEIALVCKSGSQMNKLRECISTVITSDSSSIVASNSNSFLITYIIYLHILY